MSETQPSEPKPRKVVGRNVAIALGIVCIILIASVGGLMAYYTMTLNDKNTTISNTQSAYNDYTNSHSHSNSEYDSAQTTYSNYVNTHSHSNSEYDSIQSTNNILQSIANMGQQQAILNQYTINQGSGTHSLVANFQANYAGYLYLALTSTTTNAYVIVEYWYQGRLFSVTKTLGTSGDAFFCLLPSSVAIYAGNTNFLNGATHTITATYYY